MHMKSVLGRAKGAQRAKDWTKGHTDGHTKYSAEVTSRLKIWQVSPWLLFAKMCPWQKEFFVG